MAMGLLAAIVLAIGLFAPTAVGRLRASVHQAVAVDGRMSQLAGDVTTMAQVARRYDQTYFLHVQIPAERSAHQANWERAAAELGDAIVAFEAAATDEADKRQARLWTAAFSLYSDGFRQVVAAVEAGEINTPTAANQRLEAYRQNIETLTDLSGGFAAQKRAAAERSIDLLETTGERLNIAVGLLCILGIVGALAWSLYFPARLTRPIGALGETARRLAAGDLSARSGLAGGDELGALGQALDQMAATVEQRTVDLQAQIVAAEQARREAEAARALVAEQLDTIAAQRSAIQEMSVPILPVAAGVLVMPMVGALNGERIAQAQERALSAVEAGRAAFLIIDITGVPVVDTQVAQGLVEIVQATALLGAQGLLVGIRPEVAQTIVGLGIDLGAIITRATLEAGVSYTTQAANGSNHKGQRR